MLRLIINGSSGRMGRVLAQAVDAADDCEIVAGIDPQGGTGDETFPIYTSIGGCTREADVLIDFSSPESVNALVDILIARKLPAVLATTGLSEQTEKKLQAAGKRIPILRAANMSVGVNLVKNLIFKTAMVLGPDFDVEIVERHHNQKKDAPSGTARVLADAVNRAREQGLNYIYGRQGLTGARTKSELGIHAVRGGTIVGEHDVLFAGKDEVVEVSHRAYSRLVFAEGALAAARYVASKPPGFYTMDDLVAEQTVVTNVYYSMSEALVEITGIPSKMENLATVFGAFARADINIDMISQGLGVSNTWDLSFTVEHSDAEAVDQVVKSITASVPGVSVRVETDIAKVTVGGLGMETQSGVAYRVFRAMAEADISIQAITTSETKISFVINRRSLEETLAVIKGEFGLSKA
ncbi:MAG: 4-hydroxy-tetrahydrodipicolinate reductase [Spirochaetales bacterium]|nr:4-hydroxy-tetrahydrodipicolinate reductase [Spirochaetales bacterium]